MVDTADGVPACRTSADVSLRLKLKILLTKYMLRGNMNSFNIIENLIPLSKLKNLALLFVIIPSLVPTIIIARTITILAGIHR